MFGIKKNIHLFENWSQFQRLFIVLKNVHYFKYVRKLKIKKKTKKKLITKMEKKK